MLVGAMPPEAQPVTSAWGLLHLDSLPLQSCFTGVASIPKTSSDVCGFAHMGTHTYSGTQTHIQYIRIRQKFSLQVPWFPEAAPRGHLTHFWDDLPTVQIQ